MRSPRGLRGLRGLRGAGGSPPALAALALAVFASLGVACSSQPDGGTTPPQPTASPGPKLGIDVGDAKAGGRRPIKKVPRPTENALSKARGIQIAAGARHTCMLRSDGTVACWGANDEGQFGRDAFDGAVAAVPVPRFEGVLELSAGARHTCGRRGGGDVICLGDDSLGQLGLGAFDAALVKLPQPVTGISDAVALASGREHVCALRDRGRVSCWGRRDRGQLGDGVAPVSARPGAVAHAREPVFVKGLDDAVEIRAAGDHTCARRRSGAVVCWGANDAGQLGDGTRTDQRAPVPVKGVTDAATLALGAGHSCALRDKAGVVVCWGAEGAGRLGGQGAGGGAFGETTGLADLLEVVATDASTCARRATGEVHCWGTLGGGPEPRLVAKGMMQLAGGASHVCGMLTKGGAACFGANDAGQLGAGAAGAPSPQPLEVVGLFQAQ